MVCVFMEVRSDLNILSLYLAEFFFGDSVRLLLLLLLYGLDEFIPNAAASLYPFFG